MMDFIVVKGFEIQRDRIVLSLIGEQRWTALPNESSGFLKGLGRPREKIPPFA
jgi:hypothetical protein